jgi:hypothetical protein
MRPPRAIKQEQDQEQVAVAVAPPLPDNLPTSIKQEDGVPPVPASEQVDRPIETFKELMAIKDLKKRLETFDAFPEMKKVSLLYQQLIPLPTRDPYPENWERELARAKDVAKRKIQSSFPKIQATTTTRPAETVDTDTDSDEDSQENFSLYDDDVAHAMTHGSNSNNTAPTISNAETEQLLFLENLSRCVPIITYGFHVDRHNRGMNDAFCFCPCDRDTSVGTVAGRWRSLCGMESILPVCNKNKLIQKPPNEFLAHVRAIKGCPFHGILYDFLDELYSNFYGPNNKHVGFFQFKSPGYNAAMKNIKRKETNQDRLAAEQMRKREEENQQLHQVSPICNILWSIRYHQLTKRHFSII